MGTVACVEDAGVLEVDLKEAAPEDADVSEPYDPRPTPRPESNMR